jgi:hypothetical protein
VRAVVARVTSTSSSRFSNPGVAGSPPDVLHSSADQQPAYRGVNGADSQAMLQGARDDSKAGGSVVGSQSNVWLS